MHDAGSSPPLKQRPPQESLQVHHGCAAQCLVHCPERHCLLVGGEDGSIVAHVFEGHLLGSQEHPLPLRLEGHTDEVVALVLLPGGRHMVSCSADRSLRVWDLETMQQAAVRMGPDACWGPWGGWRK